ncbi:MAG: phage tail length tape measure family protein, partial [Geminicoccaceae bacterium]
MPERLGDALLELRTDDRRFTQGITRAERGARRLDTALDQAERGAAGLGRGLVAAGTQATAAAGRMALLRGRLSQVGFQVQDIAVQLQAGVSPFLVLSQQGSQMASAFGPV